jgi:hypothetical protein
VWEPFRLYSFWPSFQSYLILDINFAHFVLLVGARRSLPPPACNLAVASFQNPCRPPPMQSYGRAHIPVTVATTLLLLLTLPALAAYSYSSCLLYIRMHHFRMPQSARPDLSRPSGELQYAPRPPQVSTSSRTPTPYSLLVAKRPRWSGMEATGDPQKTPRKPGESSKRVPIRHKRSQESDKSAPRRPKKTPR